MKKLFETADRFLKTSDWRDLTIIKFCLFSIGILLGIKIPEKHKKTAGAAAFVVFILTYIPLMAKYFCVLFPSKNEHEETMVEEFDPETEDVF